MSITLWAARLERPLSEREQEIMLALLPPGRRERLLRLPLEKQREPLCAYFILRLALRQQYGWRDLPEISLGTMGKPGFRENTGVEFNLSHTRGAVLVGLSDQPLGVDMRIRPVGRKVMARLAQADTEEDFFRCWVRWEARTKRGGNGVGSILHSEAPLPPGEHYYELDTFPGYAAGLATRSQEKPEALHRYSLDNML